MPSITFVVTEVLPMRTLLKFITPLLSERSNMVFYK